MMHGPAMKAAIIAEAWRCSWQRGRRTDLGELAFSAGGDGGRRAPEAAQRGLWAGSLSANCVNRFLFRHEAESGKIKPEVMGGLNMTNIHFSLTRRSTLFAAASIR